MTPTGRRILFVMPNARYLRFYGTTVLALSARGHEVLLGYDKPEKTGGAGLVPEGAPPRLRSIGRVPAHGGPWRALLVELGCTIDYVRFLSPKLGGTPYLRLRMQKYLPPRAARLIRVRAWPMFAVRALAWVASVVERALPVDPSLTQFLHEHAPDALVITPLVLRGPGGVQQTQLVKAARRIGIPVGLAVGSWDHLSSKGLIRVEPDMVIVWNDTQKREATGVHRIPAGRVEVTGAQPFDLWFQMRPSMPRGAFLQRVGLPGDDRPVVLYVGSSRGIARPELELPFVRQWLTELRRCAVPAVRGASVLIRPHPFNLEAWRDADLSGFGSVSIWPREQPAFPMTPDAAADYFHSIYYSSAIVGINTSAMIEASIIGRQVYTIQVPDFAPTQEGTTHFHYLVSDGGGCVLSASSFQQHVEQLASGLRDPRAGQDSRERFVSQFVRPMGMATPAVEHVVAALERLAVMRARKVDDRPWLLAPIRLALSVVARRLSLQASNRPSHGF